MRDIDSMSRIMPWPKIDATYYYAQLELLDKDRKFKGLVSVMFSI